MKATQLVEEYQIWEYHSPSIDWVSEEVESTLTAYNPSAELLQILQDRIDIGRE